MPCEASIASRASRTLEGGASGMRRHAAGHGRPWRGGCCHTGTHASIRISRRKASSDSSSSGSAAAAAGLSRPSALAWRERKLRSALPRLTSRSWSLAGLSRAAAIERATLTMPARSRDVCVCVPQPRKRGHQLALVETVTRARTHARTHIRTHLQPQPHQGGNQLGLEKRGSGVEVSALEQVLRSS